MSSGSVDLGATSGNGSGTGGGGGGGGSNPGVVTGIVSVTSAQSPYTIQPSDIYIEVNTSSGPVQVNAPDPISQRTFNIIDVGGVFSSAGCTLHRFGAEQIQGIASDFLMSADGGTYWFFADGVNYWRSGKTNIATKTWSTFGSYSWKAQGGTFYADAFGRGGYPGGGGGASGGGSSNILGGGGGGSGSAGGTFVSALKKLDKSQIIPGVNYFISVGQKGLGGAGGPANTTSSGGSVGISGSSGGASGVTTFDSVSFFNFNALVYFNVAGPGTSGKAGVTFNVGGVAGTVAGGINYSNQTGAAGGNSGLAGATSTNGAGTVFGVRGVGGTGGTTSSSTASGGGGGGGGAQGAGDDTVNQGQANGGNGSASGADGLLGQDAASQVGLGVPGGGGAGGGGAGAGTHAGGAGGKGSDGGLDGLFKLTWPE